MAIEEKATQLMPTYEELSPEIIIYFMDRLIVYKEDDGEHYYPADTIEWRYKGHTFNIKIVG